MNHDRQSLSLSAERLGIIASAVCFAHCILTPVVLSLSAVWAHYLPSEERFHRFIALLVAAVGCFAIVNGYQKHHVAVTMAGSSLMIAAHLMNHTFCKNCQRCN
jgi:hypothetical protein